MSVSASVPRISVVVCTRNNARSLEATLASLTTQTLPTGIGYEVLIVDNGSTDDTADVARKSALLPNSCIRYVTEPRQGLSRARNRGIAEAHGEIVAFIDDDALADPGWLAQLWVVYGREPRAACVGGKAVLQFPPGPLPSWYSDKLAGYLSARDLPYGPGRSARDFPFGLNMSFRKTVLDQVGGFNPMLGWGGLPGKIQLGGEEIELCLRLLHLEHAIVFQPTALVTHVVPARRLCREYFLNRTIANGYMDVMLENGFQIGVSNCAQLKKYGLRLHRRWKEYHANRSNMTEAERFFTQLTLQTTWRSVWYCLFAKWLLRRRVRELKADSVR